MFCLCFIYFNDFCQTNCLNIYQTDLHQICRVCRTMAVDKWSEVSVSNPQGTLPWQQVHHAATDRYRLPTECPAANPSTLMQRLTDGRTDRQRDGRTDEQIDTIPLPRPSVQAVSIGSEYNTYVLLDGQACQVYHHSLKTVQQHVQQLQYT